MSLRHHFMPVFGPVLASQHKHTLATAAGLITCCLLHNLLDAGPRVLVLEGNKDVTDGSMPTVATLMQQLTMLDVRHTGITADGRGWLQRGLTGLRRMRLCGRSIPEPQADALQKAWSAVDMFCQHDRCPHFHVI
jgi:hypothetical protein